MDNAKLRQLYRQLRPMLDVNQRYLYRQSIITVYAPRKFTLAIQATRAYAQRKSTLALQASNQCNVKLAYDSNDQGKHRLAKLS